MKIHFVPKNNGKLITEQFLKFLLIISIEKNVNNNNLVHLLFICHKFIKLLLSLLMQVKMLTHIFDMRKKLYLIRKLQLKIKLLSG